ncbi:uncharacterized protein LOC115339455 [Aquila chrysaetos chrysaetos]|uniref:uncharacterized protein LOC115339455 n=1 Tax=Aquila chrysaetos chrysaetos TaxID=223781 RepID=UPI001B7D3C0F|nr:uncharacterized protein LOC115339455 [Aquila chrysaetos chrysaetos]
MAAAPQTHETAVGRSRLARRESGSDTLRFNATRAPCALAQRRRLAHASTSQARRAGIARGNRGGIFRGVQRGCDRCRLVILLVETDSSHPWPWGGNRVTRQVNLLFCLQISPWFCFGGGDSSLSALLCRSAVDGGLSPADPVGEGSGSANTDRTRLNLPIAIPKRCRFDLLLKRASFFLLIVGCPVLRAQAFPAETRPSLLHVLFLQRPDDGTELLLRVESAGRAGEAEELPESGMSQRASKRRHSRCDPFPAWAGRTQGNRGFQMKMKLPPHGQHCDSYSIQKH